MRKPLMPCAVSGRPAYELADGVLRRRPFPIIRRGPLNVGLKRIAQSVGPVLPRVTSLCQAYSGNSAKPISNAMDPDARLVRPAGAVDPLESIVRPAGAVEPLESMVRPAGAVDPLESIIRLPGPMYNNVRVVCTSGTVDGDI